MLLHFIASRLVLISLSFLLALATTRYAKTAARFLKIRAQLKRTTHSWSHNLFSLVRTPLFKFRCAPSVLHLLFFFRMLSLLFWVAMMRVFHNLFVNAVVSPVYFSAWDFVACKEEPPTVCGHCVGPCKDGLPRKSAMAAM